MWGCQSMRQLKNNMLWLFLTMPHSWTEPICLEKWRKINITESLHLTAALWYKIKWKIFIIIECSKPLNITTLWIKDIEEWSVLTLQCGLRNKHNSKVNRSISWASQVEPFYHEWKNIIFKVIFQCRLWQIHCFFSECTFS